MERSYEELKVLGRRVGEAVDAYVEADGGSETEAAASLLMRGMALQYRQRFEVLNGVVRGLVEFEYGYMLDEQDDEDEECLDGPEVAGIPEQYSDFDSFERAKSLFMMRANTIDIETPKLWGVDHHTINIGQDEVVRAVYDDISIRVLVDSTEVTSEGRPVTYQGVAVEGYFFIAQRSLPHIFAVDMDSPLAADFELMNIFPGMVPVELITVKDRSNWLN